MKTLIETIGNTPLIRLGKTIENPKIELFAKLEGQNPGGSIKDRAALYMIEEAEKRGELKKGMEILEATSGNMGIALSMIGAYRGYKTLIVMSEGMSEERKKMLKGLGATLILTPKNSGTKSAIEKAVELKQKNPDRYWFSDQFNNPDNSKAHYYGLAPEILKEMPSPDFLIAGVGTSGTIMGLAKKFKEDSPKTKIIGVLPPGGYKIQGLQHPEKDFHGKIFTKKLIDVFFTVSKTDAYEMSRRTAKTEGIFTGMSSGAALFAAKKISENLENAKIVVILPDRGEKYLSTELYQ